MLLQNGQHQLIEPQEQLNKRPKIEKRRDNILAKKTKTVVKTCTLDFKLTLIFEEINEMAWSIPTRAFQSFVNLNKARFFGKKMSKHCNFGSTIFLR